MNTHILICSEELNQEDLQVLLQSIRDCEQKSFTDKKITLAIYIPEMERKKTASILKVIEPPFEEVPIVIPHADEPRRSKAARDVTNRRS